MSERDTFLPSVEMGEILRETWYKMLRNWRVLVLAFVLAGLGSVYYVLTATPTYTANGALLIDPRDGQAPDTGSQTAQGIGSLDGLTVDSELRVLTSREVTTRAMLALDFGARDEDEAKGNPSIRSRLESLLGLESKTSNGVPGSGGLREGRNREALRRDFMRSLKAQRSGESYVIDIAYTSPNLVFAADAVNTLMREYLAASGQQQILQVERTRDWLSDRIKTLEGSVREAETAVAEYRGANELVALRGEQLPTEIALSAAIENLVRLRGNELVLKVQLEQLSEQIEAGDVDAIQVPTDERSNALNEFQLDYAKLLREESEMLLSWDDNATIVQSVRRRQDQLRALILDEYRQLHDRLAGRKEALARQISATDTVITDLRAQHSDRIRETVELRNLEREADAKRQLYERLLEEFNSTSQLLTFDATSARVIAWAVPPDRKSSPQSRQIVVLAVFGALFMAVSVIYLREALDGSFRTNDDVGKDLSLPVLGLMPTFKSETRWNPLGLLFSPSERKYRAKADVKGLKKLSRAARRFGFASVRPNSLTAETMRKIHVQLMMQKEASGDGRECLIVGAASTTRGEGKTTLSFNLASYLAQQNERVAIVDMDLVSRKMSKTLGSELPQIGDLGDFLDDPYSALAKLEPVGAYHDLSVIGNAADRAVPLSMLRDNKRFEEMLGVLREEFDYIVLDFPPVQGVADTQLLMELADGLVYAIRWGVTSRSQVLSAFKQRLIPKRKVLGVLYTRAKLHKYRLYNRNDLLDYYS